MSTSEEPCPESIYKTCVSSLRTFVEEAGFSDVVIGLSGGIDSSLVAVMAVDALGSDHVHGVILPGPFSSGESAEYAQALAANLGVDVRTISIAGAYAAMCEAFEVGVGEAMAPVARENTQARCRMIYIMALSNTFGWLMLNTGNKSEAATGYSTLYGDTAGAFAPIGDVYKTRVFELARWRNEQAMLVGDTPPIPVDVMERPPSAELSDGQTDEHSLGITYKALDEILVGCIDEGRTVEEMAQAGYSIEEVSVVLDRYKASEFKRSMEPPAAMISNG